MASLASTSRTPAGKLPPFLSKEETRALVTVAEEAVGEEERLDRVREKLEEALIHFRQEDPVTNRRSRMEKSCLRSSIQVLNLAAVVILSHEAILANDAIVSQLEPRAWADIERARSQYEERIDALAEDIMEKTALDVEQIVHKSKDYVHSVSLPTGLYRWIAN